ncbi:MAG: aromatic-ring-hydroxylating dioxygenase subunit beta [Alphaproteobacteria bacterium]|nr:aromatic-ring-hydroxylating dioxygenase subunit beta [Alphaproteobacteria bacterium]
MARATKKTKKVGRRKTTKRRAARASKRTAPARAANGGLAERVEAFLYDYIDAIDSDRLEEWPEYFTDKCIYKIIPRENVERNLPISLVYCDNKGMLIDRVVSLRKANVYNLHYDRHLVSNVRVLPGKNGNCKLRASYVVYQTDLEGESMMFSTGRYDATVIGAQSAKPKFKEMVVTVDTFAIPNLISTPL